MSAFGFHGAQRAKYDEVTRFCMTFKAKPEDDPAGPLQSLLNKEKEKARSRKKEDKAYRPGPKQLLGEIHAPDILLKASPGAPTDMLLTHPRVGAVSVLLQLCVYGTFALESLDNNI